MSPSLELVLASNALGIGGTEKGLATQALALDPDRVRARVVGIREGGVRKAGLESAGLRVDVASGDRGRLADALRGADVVIVARQGKAEPLLPAAAADAEVPHLVEWSQFGHVDRSSDRSRFACHLFVSKMIALRYRRRIGDASARFGDRHRVHHHAVDPGIRERAPERRQAKLALGLDPDRPVVTRLGRAADWKWRDMLVDMVPELLRITPDAQIVLVGATPAKRRRLARRGVLERCTLIEPTSDENRLATILGATDVLASASQIGESQGIANLEAMSLGVPVVTCSTPWADNAQIEFVQHGVNGLVANHPRPFGEAVALLARDRELRERLGRAAAATVDRHLTPADLARQLERLCESLLERGRPPAEWDPSPAQVDAFAAEYERRLGMQLRALDARERVEAELTRLRERAGRARDRLRG